MAAQRPDDAASDSRPGESLVELFEALEGPLLCYALRLLKDREMAEDMVQEAFLRLQGQGDTVREPRRWLYRTVHNLALNQLRSAARVVPLAPDTPGAAPADDDPVDVQPLPDEQLARWEGIGLVRLGLQGLDPRSRLVVELKFHDGLSYQQIADRTGLTAGHVGYVLHHALKSLAGDLTRAGLLP